MDNIILQTTREFTAYTVEVLSDIFLGLTCGVLVDLLVKSLAREFSLSPIVVSTIQVFAICIVLYLMMKGSEHLTPSWHGSRNYGIVFITVFFASQANLVQFVNWIGETEDDLLDV